MRPKYKSQSQKNIWDVDIKGVDFWVDLGSEFGADLEDDSGNNLGGKN